jgi:hypothetical protein
MLHYHIETHLCRFPRRWPFLVLQLRLELSVFLYGRGTENRTLINRLKAYYFAVKLYPRHLITLVTIHDRSPFKKLVPAVGIEPTSSFKPPYQDGA